MCRKGLTKVFRVEDGVALKSFIEDLKDRVAQRAVDVRNCTWEAARASVDLHSEVTTWDGQDEPQPTRAMRGGRSRSPKGHATPTSTSAASGRSSGSTQVEGVFKGDSDKVKLSLDLRAMSVGKLQELRKAIDDHLRGRREV